MVTKGILARLEAKPGKEADLENFLRGGLAIVQGEPDTIAWYAIQIGPSTFGIFDVFNDEAGRDAHMNGQIPAALMAKADELLAVPPTLEMIDVLEVKMP